MKRRLFVEAIAKYLSGVLLVALFVFIPAGTVKYPNGWLFMSTMFLPILIIGSILLVKAPTLLEKRLNGTEMDKGQDAVVKASGLVFVASFTVSSLDFRLGFSPLPFSISIIGAFTLLISYMLYWHVLKENEFLSRTIEIQDNQHVIDTGPYGIVRHPMYSATTIMFLSIPIVLGSLSGFLTMLIYPFLLSIRIKKEERFLSDNLEGYSVYLGKVKYRIIPFIW